jgi:hypothetical protein
VDIPLSETRAAETLLWQYEERAKEHRAKLRTMKIVDESKPNKQDEEENRNFIIAIPHGRVGSSWLTNMLQRIPGVSVAGEVLEGVRGRASPSMALTSNYTNHMHRTSEKQRILEDVYKGRRPSTNSLVLPLKQNFRGLKTKIWCTPILSYRYKLRIFRMLK